MTTSPLDFAKWYFPATAPNHRLHSGERHDHAEISARDPAAPRSVGALAARPSATRVFRPDQNQWRYHHRDRQHQQYVARRCRGEHRPNNDPTAPSPVRTDRHQQNAAPAPGLVAWTDSLSTSPGLSHQDKEQRSGPITLRLRDQVMEWRTPPSRQAVPGCASPYNVRAVSAKSTPAFDVVFAPTPTVWDKTNITCPAQRRCASRYHVKYAYTSCATLTASTAGGQIIRNIARIDYTYNRRRITQAFVDTK